MREFGRALDRIWAHDGKDCRRFAAPLPPALK
jgi:hypothetical protein